MRCTSAITPSHPGYVTFLLQVANIRIGVTDHRIVAISGCKGSETFKVDAPETLFKRGSKLENTKLKPSMTTGVFEKNGLFPTSFELRAGSANPLI